MSAWIEPGTVSLFLYCSTLLLRGRAGTRVLLRHLKHGRDTVTGVALDEFSDFLCDHPDALLTVLFCSFLAGPRCRLVARAPALLRCARSPKILARASTTLTRTGRVQLLHFLRWPHTSPTRLALQQAQANADEPGAFRLHLLPAIRLRIPVLFRRKGRGLCAPVHLLRQLAEAVFRSGEAKG
jgi:hypothetical protein